MTLFEKVVAEPPSWASETIQSWNDFFEPFNWHDAESFVVRRTSEQDCEIDMRDVVGQHEHYAGHTWLEAATKPLPKATKMRTKFGLFDKNPNYYFNGDIARDMYFMSIDGKTWFSDGEGNHRTVVAKFGCEQLHREAHTYPLVKGVTKVVYDIDFDSLRLYAKMRDLESSGIIVRVCREEEKEHGGDARTTAYRVTFDVTDLRFSDARSEINMTPKAFAAYARYLFKNGTQLSTKDRILHHWRRIVTGDTKGLIYS